MPGDVFHDRRLRHRLRLRRRGPATTPACPDRRVGARGLQHGCHHVQLLHAADDQRWRYKVGSQDGIFVSLSLSSQPRTCTNAKLHSALLALARSLSSWLGLCFLKWPAGHRLKSMKCRLKTPVSGKVLMRPFIGLRRKSTPANSKTTSLRFKCALMSSTRRENNSTQRKLDPQSRLCSVHNLCHPTWAGRDRN